MTVQWRPEQNALTTPRSSWVRIIPKNSVGYAALLTKIREEYTGRMVDILDVSGGG